MRTALLLAGASLLVLSGAPRVHAQTTPSAQSRQDSTSLAAVVVTAQRRSEKLKDVPLTVTTVTGAALEKAGITSVRDLQNVVSGLTFSGQGTVSQPSIRGVSTSLSAAGSENPNALYVDGVYQLDQVSLNADLPDVQNLEVLKGPQGTLFGRNATGGAILITTKAPSFTPKGDFTISPSYYTGSGGSHTSGRIDLKGFVTGPIINDLLAGSFAASTDTTDGYLTDDYAHKQTGRISKQNYRGKLLWTPTARFQATLSAFYFDDDDQGLLGATALPGLSVGDFFPGSVVPTQPYHVASDNGFFVATAKQYGATINAQYDFDAGTLKSITAYGSSYSYNQNSISYARGSAACIEYFACIDYAFGVNDDQVSQEFNFASHKIGIFSYVAGLYYFDAVGSTLGIIQKTDPAFGGFGLSVQKDTFHTTSYAIYGEGTADLTDRLSIVLGLRYNEEPHTDLAKATETSAPAGPKSTTFTGLTPRVSVRYEVTPTLNAYVTYSQGSKSGLTGVTNTASRPTPFAPVAPEILTSYEAGLKYGAHNLTLNAAFFYYDYKNKQEQTFEGTSTVIQNTGPVRIYGFDLDGNVRINQDFRVNANLTWIPEAKYLDFPNASGQSTVFELGCSNSPTTVGFCPGYRSNVTASGTFDDTGGRLIRTPEVTANATLTYSHGIAAGVIDASTTVTFSSSYNQDLTGVIHQGAYAALNAQTGFHFANSGLRVGIFGRNLTNEAYMVNALTSSAGFIAGYAAPREIGLTANYAF